MTGSAPDLTGSGLAVLALAVFIIAYALVIAEEFLHLRKSKPVVVAAGIIWILAGVAALRTEGLDAAALLQHNLLEYAGLLLFLLAAMTYVNTLDERNVFAALRSWMLSRGFSLRTIFWLCGLFSFLLAPLLDNLTTALVMGAVALSVGRGNPRFLVPTCVSIVIAANAGGAFSPFGNITTLMVWQKGVIDVAGFFHLFLPSLVNWLVSAACMHFAVPRGQPLADAQVARVKPGGYAVILLFAFTVALTVSMHQWLHLPSFLGMTTGLGVLMVYGHVIRGQELRAGIAMPPPSVPDGFKPVHRPFDVFISIKRVEWDTLLFFFGVVLSVGGLAAFGYLAVLSQHSYAALGPSATNIAVGVASAVIDNIPIMYAVLTMDPQMSLGQWLLVTMTAGVGGSLLSIGSAAGVALMGQARGIYTFMTHLKWTWAVALGYVASIWVHFAVNAALF